MTTPDRIIDLLDRHPEGLTDTQISNILNLPKPSVRRTRNRLEAEQRVFMHGVQSGRALVFTTTRPPLPAFNADEAQA